MRTLSACVLAIVAGSAAVPAMGGSRAPLVDSAQSMRRAASVAIGERVTLRVPVPGGDETLDLVRFTPLAPGAQVVEVGEDGIERPLDVSDLVLLKGTIRGDEDSLAFISVHGDRVNGFIRSQVGMRIISSAEGDAPLSFEAAQDLNIGDGTGFCSVDSNDPSFYPMGVMPEPVEDTGATGRGGPCRVASVAVETDYEFSDLFANTVQSAAYAITLMGASSTIYERDVNVRLVLPFLRVWAANNDPYSGNSSGGYLDQVLAYWNGSMSHIQRNVVHGLSGRNLGGGVAYLNALCNLNFAYGVSGNINGFFPYPVQDNSTQNWDLMVVSHELGHNFGSGHTHDGYNPPIDGCGNNDCTLALDSTIMSYCHLCPGGLGNVDMRFHPRVQDRILTYLSSAPCDLTADATPSAIDDFAEALGGTSIAIDVLFNDDASACAGGQVQLVSFSPTSANGGTIAAENGVTPLPRLIYTAPTGYTGGDFFTYTTNAGSATVFIDVVEPRPSVVVPNTEPGVAVDYYALSNPQVLPDFDSLTPYDSDVVSEIGFESTNGNFATSGRADQVGARFTGLMEVPETGWYTLSVSSDDGSKLWIGDDLVIDNDGLHGMQERSARVALQAGKHPVSVGFFENGGGAGVVVRYASDSIGRQVVPASAWSRNTTPPCFADLAEPFGSLNIFDLQAYIGLYNAQDASADLAAPFGTFNIFDLQAYINLYNAGCP